MNRIWVLGLIAVAAGVVAGCDGSRSASEVAHDSASAEQVAGDNAAKVQQRADARIASARGDVRDQERDLAHVEVGQTQGLADTQADGDLKIALARCESLGGATQKSCRDQANADFDVARAKANQVSANSDPKP